MIEGTSQATAWLYSGVRVMDCLLVPRRGPRRGTVDCTLSRMLWREA